MGFRRYHLGGLRKVKTEFALVAMAHNLRKVYLKGIQKAPDRENKLNAALLFPDLLAAPIQPPQKLADPKKHIARQGGPYVFYFFTKLTFWVSPNAGFPFSSSVTIPHKWCLMNWWDSARCFAAR